MHCVKLLSDTQESVRIRVSYDNLVEDNKFEDFLYDGNENSSTITICKILSEEFHGSKVRNVGVQSQNSKIGSWRSRGVLVQDVPGGK